MPVDFATEVEAALTALRNGGVILYPTDTVWGLGCDAANEDAVKKIYAIKQRSESKSVIVLAADERDVLNYVSAPDLAVFDFIQQQEKPTTIIFNGAVNLPEALVADDGSIAIRIVQDEFCRHLIRRLRKPIVSTSANISGEPSPRFFDEINDKIKLAVGHVVQWRQDDKTPAQPSQIIRWKGEGNFEYIRK